ncbi:hypothetical protein Tco_0973741 [Tanacetum coccineum]|uniref:Uncharacterized protein n=1 Tax=Tanacetum coccineum TaxID=301880 RepID=A0ABQ5E9K5_9ASTR
MRQNNNLIKTKCHRFKKLQFINPFCTPVQESGCRLTRNLDIRCALFQPLSNDFRWTEYHPLEQVCGNPTMPVQTRRPAMPQIPENVHVRAHCKLQEPGTMNYQTSNVNRLLLKDSGFKLTAFSDADHAGCLDNSVIKPLMEGYSSLVIN